MIYYLLADENGKPLKQFQPRKTIKGLYSQINSLYCDHYYRRVELYLTSKRLSQYKVLMGDFFKRKVELVQLSPKVIEDAIKFTNRYAILDSGQKKYAFSMRGHSYSGFSYSFTGLSSKDSNYYTMVIEYNLSPVVHNALYTQNIPFGAIEIYREFQRNPIVTANITKGMLKI